MCRYCWMIVCALLLLPGQARADFITDLATTLVTVLGGEGADAPVLTESDIAAGLKEALRVGSERVVGRLAKIDGFNADPKIHIPLPRSMQRVDSLLSSLGMANLLNNLELKLNRAAEAATPRAERLFIDAIRQMTIVDAKHILRGRDDAATIYFRKKMSGPLAEEMRPIVEKVLAEVGAVEAYDRVMKKYKSLPFVPDVKGDLVEYVVEGGLDGIFHYMAEEEAAIRKDPAKRTTEILRKVFGK